MLVTTAPFADNTGLENSGELLLLTDATGAVIRGFAPTTAIVTNPEMLYLSLGILGATVMPHNLYLHSSIVQTRKYMDTHESKKEAIRFATIDSSVALMFALFINAALRLSESDARYEGTDTPVWRSWLVGGVGAAHVSIPQPKDTPTGCGCFGAASASGAAYQLKLVLERQISQNGWLAHLQLAHVWLPSASTAAASLPQTHYGRFDTGTVSIGIRKLFD